jgi:hypothetical protein
MLKLRPGSEPLVYHWFGGVLPAPFLQPRAWGVCEEPDEEASAPYLWAARELADETWGDFMTARGAAGPPPGEVLPIFAVACEGVAALHAAGVYQWSAHARNFFRVGDRWRLGALGGCVVATAPDDGRFRRWVAAEGFSPMARGLLRSFVGGGPWCRGRHAGFCAPDADRGRRLRRDDCAMLGGLLVDLLGLNRWEVFLQALTGRPPCGGRYVLTGDPETDEALSRVLNRAWRGDAGGALALAAGGGDTYDDPTEMLADVEAAHLHLEPAGAPDRPGGGRVPRPRAG